MDAIVPPIPQEKQCTGCQAFFPATLDYFPPNKQVKSGLMARCRTCTNEEKQRYRQANKETILARDKLYVQQHREQVRERDNAHAVAHREVHRVYSRRHYQEHPEDYRVKARIRRARKAGAPGQYTAQDAQEQYKRQRGECYYCSVKLGKHYEIDHIVPLSRGGTNHPWNIVIACVSCNRSKHNKLLSEWQKGGRLL